MSHIYAVVFDSGVIKFGRSENLAPRLSSHVSDGLIHGAVCVSALVCRVSDSVAAERSILSQAYISLDKVDHGREYFTGNADDAFDVMAMCGFLPVHTQPVKVGQSLQFVVARTADVASRYVHASKRRASESELTREKILRLLSSREGGGVTEGVIFNRVRGIARSVVADMLLDLTEEKVVHFKEDVHPRNGKVIKHYFLSKKPVDTPISPC